MSKRKKITFGSINNGNFSIIPASDVAKSRKRISDAMKPIIRDFKKKQVLSKIASQKLIINK